MKFNRVRRKDDYLMLRFPSQEKARLKTLADRPEIRRDPSDLARWLILRGLDELERQHHYQHQQQHEMLLQQQQHQYGRPQ
jgi:hypothetical protein